SVLDVRLGKRELERALAIACREVERKHFTTSEQVVRRVFQAEERTADTRNTTVERDLLATTLANLQRKIDSRFFIVCTAIDVFVFVDGIEVAELVELDDRVFPVRVVVDVAFIDEHL